MANKIPVEKFIENIKIKTGKTPEDFKRLAMAKGFFEKGILKTSVRATEVIAWLKKDFDLGYGHSLAIYHTFKDNTDKNRK